MTYKTILVHVNQSRHCPQRTRIAARLAVAQHAHLVGGAASGVSASCEINLQTSIVASHLAFLTQCARHALGEFENTARQAGVETFESRLIDDDASTALALQGRHSDLIVLGQTDPHEPGVSPIDLPETVLIECARPVLIVPHAGTHENFGRKTLIAWDGSIEASRAVGLAVPLLQQADEVVVCVLNAPSRPKVHGAEPGADLALYLARHGIKVEVLPNKTAPHVDDMLLALIAEIGADSLVMGAYGHTRFREIVLGGATAGILKKMTVPVLLAH